MKASQPANCNLASEQLSMERIIDLVREIRKGQIKAFLKADYILQYFAATYHRDLTPLKMEFLYRNLQHLLIAPVDLLHYSAQIKRIKDSNSAGISETNHNLFLEELEVLFKKYLF